MSICWLIIGKRIRQCIFKIISRVGMAGKINNCLNSSRRDTELWLNLKKGRFLLSFEVYTNQRGWRSIMFSCFVFLLLLDNGFLQLCSNLLVLRQLSVPFKKNSWRFCPFLHFIRIQNSYWYRHIFIVVVEKFQVNFRKKQIYIFRPS